jgi:hypothetical protein
MSTRALAVLLLLAGVVYAQQADASTSPAPDPAPDPGTDSGGWLDDIMGTIGMNPTRGERNNNPGNIRLSSVKWQGEISGQDTAFATFATPEDGIRALAKLLRNYQTKNGLNTVRGIINRYAPPVENNTSAYVAAVAAAVGVAPDDQIDTGNPTTLNALVNAIIRHENGRNVYAASTVAAGVALA